MWFGNLLRAVLRRVLFSSARFAAQRVLGPAADAAVVHVLNRIDRLAGERRRLTGRPAKGIA
ncbi:hypothetical protein [Humisphaera borealis]|uniref:Uncharacterized protein n=1 Tax=Humisphaera borealis TaxID=2807512 RepID=A0A7M2X3R7_9BACT|nr:hypothetical protein [Humisphaera borealis]QOV92082.1 hypothetical protein IPV69_12305 [Humisphaera borealis]